MEREGGREGERRRVGGRGREGRDLRERERERMRVPLSFPSSSSYEATKPIVRALPS